MTLVVQDEGGEGKKHQELKFESNPVTQKEFGEYVASLHSCNNSMFILQYQVLLIARCIWFSAYGYTNSVLLQSLVSGEKGREVKFGRSEANRPLNRFRNITTYEFIT